MNNNAHEIGAPNNKMSKNKATKARALSINIPNDKLSGKISLGR